MTFPSFKSLLWQEIYENKKAILISNTRKNKM